MNWLFLLMLWFLVSPAVAWLIGQMFHGQSNFIDQEQEARDVMTFAERTHVEAWRKRLPFAPLYSCRVEGCNAIFGAQEALAQSFYCGRHHANRVLATRPRRKVGR